MALDGGTIAAIITGILALLGAVATAWLSGWNESRQQRRKNLQAIGKHAMPLLVAAWDLHNWLFDILDAHNYSEVRTKAYGDGWNSEFTSYLLGKYLAAVQILGVKTQYFSFVDDEQTEKLKVLLWKIQDEFTTMNHEDRLSLEMRWFEGDILAVQEHMTVISGEDLRTMGRNDFRRCYKAMTEPGSPSLHTIFGAYDTEFQRIVYRRFKLEHGAMPDRCPVKAIPSFETELDKSEHEWTVAGRVKVPDHRVRRLQHLLADVVELADTLSFTRLRRPVRRWDPSIMHETDREWVACDCSWSNCKPATGKKFWWRPADVKDSGKGFSRSMSLHRQQSMPLDKNGRNNPAMV